MKNLTLYITLLLVSFSLNANADKHKDHSNMDHSKMKHDKNDGHDHKNDVAKVVSNSDGKIKIKVKGMVCAFCAQGIEKNFGKEDAVKSTKVDLDKMEVTLELKEGKTLSEETMKKVVTGAGFSFEGIKK